MHICLVGNPEDLNAAYLGWHAEKRGWEVTRLAEPAFGDSWTVHWRDDSPGDGVVETSSGSLRGDDIQGAIVRFEPSPPLPSDLALEPDLAMTLIIERRAALQHWLNYLPGHVVNRPAAGRANGSKPYQMRRLGLQGLQVPVWRLTNQVRDAEDFAKQHGQRVIAKSPSGLRSRVRWMSDELLSRLEHGSTPVLLQRYIEGVDVRVHVVVDSTGTHAPAVFPTEVSGGEGVDYRFDSDNREYAARSIPDSVRDACVRAAVSEGLTLAGLDFKVDAHGQFWCLEMNPVPTFLPYEAMTGQPIAAAVLDGVAATAREARRTN